ncbi:MAG: glycosyltransferase [Candidatus Bipolaricaulaceae bacterium]
MEKIGFVSTRLAGTDGVSLEVRKWGNVLSEQGYELTFFAGECDWPADRSRVVPEAHFQHPQVRAVTEELFGRETRGPSTSRRVAALKDHLKGHLHSFVAEFGVEIMVVENALSLPVNVPLGLALAELIAETGIPTIAHHHDFWWERRRFALSAAGDYLRAAFPPVLPSVHHVVINSFGGSQLALRTGATSVLIPNVMDFETPLPPPDAHTIRLRPALGVPTGTFLLLQPTRIVPRKRIELAMELVRRLELPCVLVVSHSAGDEGTAYKRHLERYADLLGVDVIFAHEFIAHGRRTTGGKELFSLADAYRQADLVTYPSTVEGFGNAFLEAVYYRRPLVMSTYEIFQTDIAPKGFEVIEFGDFIGEDTVRRARAVLENPALAEDWVEHNYQVARRHYSFAVLEKYLAALMGRARRS